MSKVKKYRELKLEPRFEPTISTTGRFEKTKNDPGTTQSAGFQQPSELEPRNFGLVPSLIETRCGMYERDSPYFVEN